MAWVSWSHGHVCRPRWVMQCQQQQKAAGTSSTHPPSTRHRRLAPAAGAQEPAVRHQHVQQDASQQGLTIKPPALYQYATNDADGIVVHTIMCVALHVADKPHLRSQHAHHMLHARTLKTRHAHTEQPASGSMQSKLGVPYIYRTVRRTKHTLHPTYVVVKKSSPRYPVT